MHVRERRAVVADWFGEFTTTVGGTHRIVDEHPVRREQFDPALQIFALGNLVGVTNSGHIVIRHELFLSRQCGSIGTCSVSTSRACGGRVDGSMDPAVKPPME
jgi:hypothetical protein